MEHEIPRTWRAVRWTKPPFCLTPLEGIHPWLEEILLSTSIPRSPSGLMN